MTLRRSARMWLKVSIQGRFIQFYRPEVMMSR